MTPTIVTTWGAAQTVQEGGPPAFVTIALVWTACDPYAVKATIRSQSRVVVWAWSRDLLTEGLTRATGAGDVRVEPVDRYVSIHLRTPCGTARLLLSGEFLKTFLDRTYAITPAGTEYDGVDCETELREFLEAA